MSLLYPYEQQNWEISEEYFHLLWDISSKLQSVLITPIQFESQSEFDQMDQLNRLITNFRVILSRILHQPIHSHKDIWTYFVKNHYLVLVSKSHSEYVLNHPYFLFCTQSLEEISFFLGDIWLESPVVEKSSQRILEILESSK
jgi:hypothetical protein